MYEATPLENVKSTRQRRTSGGGFQIAFSSQLYNQLERKEKSGCTFSMDVVVVDVDGTVRSTQKSSFQAK